MSSFVNIHDAKTHLSALLQKVAAGGEVVIARSGKPVARLVPFREKKERRPGSARGAIVVADDFDAPLPPDVIDTFEK